MSGPDELLARIDEWLAELDDGVFTCNVGELLRDCRTRIAANAALAARCGELERIIREHNEECQELCTQRRAAGTSQCPMLGYARQCADCPLDGLVDTGTLALRQALASQAEGER